jgi:hypothetical protein
MGNTLDESGSETNRCTSCFYPRTGLPDATPCPECGTAHQPGSLSWAAYRNRYSTGSAGRLLVFQFAFLAPLVVLLYQVEPKLFRAELVVQRAAGFIGVMGCALTHWWISRQWHSYLIVSEAGLTLKPSRENARLAGLAFLGLMLLSLASAGLIVAGPMHVIALQCAFAAFIWMLVPQIRQQVLGREVNLAWSQMDKLNLTFNRSRVSGRRVLALKAKQIVPNKFKLFNPTLVQCWMVESNSSSDQLLAALRANRDEVNVKGLN